MDSPTSAETLPLFYSEPYIQVNVYPHRETDRWQLHRHGTREGLRTAWKAIWQRGPGRYERLRAIWNESRTTELHRKKGRNPENKGVGQQGEVGELQEAHVLTEDCHTLRVGVSLWMWGWNVYWLQCNRSRDGCVHLLYTAQFKWFIVNSK